MREHTYRVWDTVENDWFYFNLIPFLDAHEEAWGNVFAGKKIDLTKVCRWTGLKDKNGVKIYEDDIVKFHEIWERYYYIDKQNKSEDETMPIGTVRITTYKGATCRFPIGRYTQLWEDHMTSGERPLKGEWNLSNSTKNWEVIGNIHQNLELLKAVA